MAAMRGIGLGVFYALAYLWLRTHSMDQWYLPAGLRVAALLLTPRRYWWALFAADVVATFSLTLPLIPNYGTTWAYLSPFVTFPPVALIIHQAHKCSFLPCIKGPADIAWFLGMAFACSIATTSVNKTLGALLMGSATYAFNFEKSIIFQLGQYLGILMIATPALVLAQRDKTYRRPGAYTLKSLLVAALAYGLYVAIFILHPPLTEGLYALQFVVLLPVVWLTFRHGWRGAVLGSAVADLCVGLTLHQRGVGVADQGPLLVQVALAFIATAFIGLGGKITHQASVAAERKRQVRNAEQREQEAWEHARAGYTYGERALREKRDQLTTTLAPRGLHLVGQETTRIPGWLNDIYSLDLDESGLFAALKAVSFRADLEGTSTLYCMSLRGDCCALTEPVQQTLYRLAYDAVHHLALTKPAEIRLSLKIIDTPIPKAVLLVRSFEPCETIALPSPRMASLKARARAFDAAVRVRDRSVAVVLSDVDVVAPAAMVGGRG